MNNASALAEVQEEVFSEALDSALATHTDISKLESSIKANIRAAHDDLVKVERSMDDIDAKMDKLSWMVGLLIAQATANFVAKKTVPI